MKKRYIISLAALLLLSGCSGNEMSSFSEYTTTAIVATSPRDSFATAAPVQKSAEQPNEEYTSLRQIELNSQLTDTVFENSLTAQIGYDIPVDVTQHPDYAWTMEQLPTLSEEERQGYASHNYHHIFMSAEYVGSDTAAWIVAAEYFPCITDGKVDASYTRIFLVNSDGILGEELLSFEGGLCALGQIERVGDEVYISSDAGLYVLDVRTMKLDRISSTPSSYDRSNSRFMVYTCHEQRCAKIYDRSTGNTITTDIYMGYYDGTVIKLTESYLLYHAEDGSVMAVDLVTGDVASTSYGSQIFTQEDIFESELYSVDRYVGERLWNEFTVHNKRTGEDKKYSTSVFPAGVLEGINVSPLRIKGDGAIVGEWLYIEPESTGSIIAINLKDDTIGRIDTENIGFLNYYEYGIIGVHTGGMYYRMNIGENQSSLDMEPPSSDETDLIDNGITQSSTDLKPPSLEMTVNGAGGYYMNKGNYTWEDENGTPVDVWMPPKTPLTLPYGAELRLRPEGGGSVREFAYKLYSENDFVTDDRVKLDSDGTLHIPDELTHGVIRVTVDYPKGECEYFFCVSQKGSMGEISEEYSDYITVYWASEYCVNIAETDEPQDVSYTPTSLIGAVEHNSEERDISMLQRRTASKLPVGTKLYNCAEREDIVLADNNGEWVAYLKMINDALMM